MSHDPHFGSVIAAYAFALVIVGGMMWTILADYFRLKHALSLLSAQEKPRGGDFQERKGRDQRELDMDTLE